MQRQCLFRRSSFSFNSVLSKANSCFFSVNRLRLLSSRQVGEAQLHFAMLAFAGSPNQGFVLGDLSAWALDACHENRGAQDGPTPEGNHMPLLIV